MRKNLSKALFKFAPMVGLFVFVGISSAKPTVNIPHLTAQTKPFSSLDNKSYVNYQSSSAGWYDTSKIVTDTKREFEPTEYTLDYGMYFTGGSGIDDIIDYEITSLDTLKLTCPFVIPKVKDNYGAFSPSGNDTLVRYISMETEDMTTEDDVWENVDIIYDNGGGQPNFKTNPTIIGTKPGGGSSTLSCTITKAHGDYGGKGLKAIQDLQIKLNSGSIFDYTSISISFTDIKFEGQVYNIEEGGLYKPRYEKVNTGHPNYTLTLTPASKISGTKLNRNLAKVSKWYEAAKTYNSNGSFIDRDDAEEAVTNEIINDCVISNGAYTNAYYNQSSGVFEFTSEHNTYQDYLGHNQGLSGVVYPGEEFEAGYDGDIYIVPIYNEIYESDLKHSIKSFKAFKKVSAFTQPMLEVILPQMEYLVYERNVFEHKNPADPWFNDGITDPTGTKSPVFTDYEFYDSSFTVNNRNSSFKMGTLEADDTSFDYVSKTAYTDITTITPNSFSTFESGTTKFGVVGQVTNIFNARDYSGEEWKKAIVPSGTDSFKGTINGMFSSSDLTPKYYMLGVGETSNTITFNSSDVMFVRITKNDSEVTELTASQLYNLSSSALATTGAKTSPVYSISSEGSYYFEIFNRSDSKVTSRLLYVSEEAKFSTSLPQVTNTDLKISYTVPSNVSFTSIILKQGTSTSHQTEPSYQEEVTSEPAGFTQLTKDDDGTSITTNIKTYHFTQTEKDFHPVYYLELVTSLKTKRYLIYWNYQWADYSLTTNKLGNGDITGAEATYQEDSYTNITITPAVDNKITSIKWNGEEEVIKDPTSAFTLKKQMTVNSTLDVVFDSINYHYLTISYDDTYGTVTGEERNYSEFEETNIVLTAKAGCKIKSITWGDEMIEVTDISTMTIKRKLTKATTLTVVFSEIKNQFDLTVTKVGNGTLEGTPSGTYDDGDEINITAKPDAGYYTSFVSWNGEELAIDDPSETHIKKNIKGPTELIITFSKIPNKYKVTLLDTPTCGTITGIEAEYNENSITAITIKANDGYYISSVLWNGEQYPVESQVKEILIAKTITSDVTLAVAFSEIPKPKDNTGLIVGVCCGVGAVAIGVGTFLIIRAKKVGSMKK